MNILLCDPSLLLRAGAVLTAALAALLDHTLGRIPNVFAASALCASAAIHVLESGPCGLLPFLTGLAPPLMFLIPAFLTRMTGAGDIKLLMALGSFFGASGAVRLLLAVFVCGGVYALLTMARYRLFARRFRYFLSYAADVFSTGVIRPYRQEGDRPENVRFGIPIFLGTLLYIGGIF